MLFYNTVAYKCYILWGLIFTSLLHILTFLKERNNLLVYHSPCFLFTLLFTRDKLSKTIFDAFYSCAVLQLLLK